MRITKTKKKFIFVGIAILASLFTHPVSFVRTILLGIPIGVGDLSVYPGRWGLTGDNNHTYILCVDHGKRYTEVGTIIFNGYRLEVECAL